MCCADVHLTDQNYNSEEYVFRCMTEDTVKYNYGVTVTGNIKVLF